MKYFSIFAVCIGLCLGISACGSKKTDDQASKVEKESNKAAIEKGDPKNKEFPTAKAKPKEAFVSTDGPKPASMTKEKLAASHILLMHKNSERKPPAVTRTKEDAKKIADDLYGRLKAGADFADLAREFSDCPTGKKNGGNLGVFRENQMAPEFVEGVKSVAEGEFTEPVESPFGYHIIKRHKVEEMHFRHILIMHDGSERKLTSISRKKEDAEKLIKEIAKKIADGSDFTELAKEYSDCPSGKRRGGDLGRFGRGKMAPLFEDVAFALKENEISGIVETNFGYHLIQRLP